MSFGLKETCHCGHDKASHYVDQAYQPPKLISCLCRGCDCPRYADANGPKVPKCTSSKFSYVVPDLNLDDDDAGPETPRMDSWRRY